MSFTGYLKQFNLLSSLDDKSTFPCLQILFGNSDFLRHAYTLRCKSLWEKQPNREVMHSSFEGIDVDEIQEQFLQNPMFSQQSLTICRNPNQTSLARALESIQSPRLHEHFLIICKEPTLNAALENQLLRFTHRIVLCEDPKPYEFDSLVNWLATLYQIELQAGANHLILDYIGRDLVLLENEIKRLNLIFVEDDRRVRLGPKELKPHLGFLREDLAFKLKQYLIDGQAGRAQILIQELIQRGESSLAVLGLLSKHIRQCLKLFDASSLPPGQQAKAADVSPKMIQPYRNYVRKIGANRLLGALRLCSSADRNLKQSRMSEDLLLSEIILELSAN